MNKRILLIEDNVQNRYLANFLLEARGWEMVHAEDGPTGVALAGQIDPVLILLDIQLPGMDGYAVAKALRSDPKQQAIPIVAVTSYAMAGDRERCLAAGCNGYIEKPINPETFVSEIERHLENAPGKSTHE